MGAAHGIGGTPTALGIMRVSSAGKGARGQAKAIHRRVISCAQRHHLFRGAT